MTKANFGESPLGKEKIHSGNREQRDFDFFPLHFIMFTFQKRFESNMSKMLTTFNIGW